MKKKIVVLLFIIIEILLMFIEIKYLDFEYGVDRFIILSLVNFYGFCHLFFPIKKMYDYIYRKRYIIAGICLIVLTLLKYHGSSLVFWNNAVQPSYNVRSGSIVLGVPRFIRGDEFAVGTPSAISQYFNNFESISNLLMGKSDYVTLYPSLPSKDISILGNLCGLPYLFLPIENAFSMAWFLRLFLIFFASFELCMLVTKNNRLYALVGAMMIAFSGASCWWGNMIILGWGALAVIILNSFLKSDKFLKRLIFSIMMGIVGFNYLMIMYPAWQVAFGYLYLGFFIWLLIENRKKLNFKMLLYIPIVLAVMFGMFLPVFLNSYSIFLQTMSTVYPGARLSVGNSGYQLLFSYYLSVFFPIKPFFNPCEYSNFISFYPLPIIISVFSFIKDLIKKIKFDLLLLILTIIAILLSIWNFIEIPVWFSKISLLSFSTPERCQLVVGYICIFILIRFISLYGKEEKISIKHSIISGIISLLFNIIILFLVNSWFDEFLTSEMMLVIVILFVPIVTLIILNNKKTNTILALLLIGVSFLTGVVVNPIAKGINVFFDKPVAKEIRNIRNDDEDGRWLVVGNNYSLPNYVLANGVITINSTNFYPNLELWQKFDSEGEYEFVYNRYAHILFKFTDEETNFQLLYPDSFAVNLNIGDLDKLEADYILAEYDIGEYVNDVAVLLYNDAGMYIYEIND